MATILVIDDTAMLRDYLAECLRYEGFTVATARNGTEGIQAAVQNLPDLIICDIMMPGLNGYAVLQKLRAQPATARIPFIFLTALAGYQEMQEGFDLGGSAYLTKPFSHADLIGAIQAKLGTQPAGV